MHTYIICIGSNYNKEVNLLWAQKQLMVLFPSIRFADAKETEPFLLHNPVTFINQVAQFTAGEEPEQIKEQLKTIERMAGRLPEDKVTEKIVLDIDLLMVDDIVLKPEDMEREYIKNSLIK